MPQSGTRFYEWLIVAYNSDTSLEAVATFNTEVTDIYKKREVFIQKLRDQGFNNVVWIKGTGVSEQKEGFDKVSINKPSRRNVYLYLYYIELSTSLEKSFCRQVSISEIDRLLLSSIEAIRKNLRWQYKRYEIKECFEPKRIKFILKRHFS